MKELGESITSLVFYQFGSRKRLYMHFLAFRSNWSRFHSCLRIVNGCIHTFEDDREGQVIGSSTKGTYPKWGELLHHLLL